MQGGRVDKARDPAGRCLVLCERDCAAAGWLHVQSGRLRLDKAGVLPQDVAHSWMHWRQMFSVLQKRCRHGECVSAASDSDGA
jgi:hypothetical protein